MGLDVFVNGRLRLSATDEAALLEGVRRWLPLELRDLDFDELFTWVGQTAVRRVDEEWVELSWDLDDDGDPKWRGEATAFYADLGDFVSEGRVDIESVDGGWSYIYEDGRIIQVGRNDYDGEDSLEASLQRDDPRRR